MLRFGLIALLLPALLGAAELSDQVSEILKQNCLACHGAALRMSKLDLRTRDSVLRGGERGPAIIPHNPKRSLLYKFVSHEMKPEMPPGGKLSEGEIDTLRRWIVAGGNLGTLTAEQLDKKAALAKLEQRPISDEERGFWSFRSPARPETPDADGMPSEGAIDAFLAASLNEKGLKPSPRADKRTLVRRAYLDLIGFAAQPRASRGFSQRRFRRRLAAVGRSTARLAALRGTLGPSLARLGALCRLGRLRTRLRLAANVALPRLRG